MAEPNRSIRRALEGYAEELSHLAYVSKAYWGYTDEFMRCAKPFLKITPEHIRRTRKAFIWPKEQAESV